MKLDAALPTSAALPALSPANESAGVVFSGFCGELGNRQSGGLRAKVSVLFAFFVLNFQRSCLKKN